MRPRFNWTDIVGQFAFFGVPFSLAGIIAGAAWTNLWLILAGLVGVVGCAALCLGPLRSAMSSVTHWLILSLITCGMTLLCAVTIGSALVIGDWSSLLHLASAEVIFLFGAVSMLTHLRRAWREGA